MIDLYVYYKVAAGQAAQLELLVRSMQSRLAPAHATAPQLKRRPELRDGLQTWMEVYPGVSEGFAETLAAAARDAGVDKLISGPRHTEVFMDLTACA